MIRLHKSTRYALYAAMEMAASREHVTVPAVAARHEIPASVLAKVFQQLVRAGIAVGTRGAGGGYRLVRRPGRLTLLDVVEAIEPARATTRCPLDDRGPRRGCESHATCRLHTVLEEVDEYARCTFASVSLEALIRRPRARVDPHKHGSAGA